MKLHYREIPGIGNPILILHGLFGSSKNWMTTGKELSSIGPVYLLDLRNHGDSPHSPEHHLKDMVEDVLEFIEFHDLSSPILLGHSMGGLVCMLFTHFYPTLVYKLIVVDIAPRSYELNYHREFAALRVDPSKFKNRDEIDLEMAKHLPDSFIRKFLQMNLERKEEGGYRWKLNVDAIEKSKQGFQFQIPSTSQFFGESLFIFGEKSEYIQTTDIQLIRNYFPHSHIRYIPEAGHYLHYTHASEFLRHVKEFSHKKLDIL
jgi:pimeloyl-ACP methyl ester carboxylesterase